MLKNVVQIEKDQLLTLAHDMFYNYYRFVTATCVDLGDGRVDILYHFDRDLEMKHYRLTVKKEEEIPSISRVFFCALLVENEMMEMFGLNITNIVIDYGGHLLLADDAPDAPMARRQITIEKREAAK